LPCGGGAAACTAPQASLAFSSLDRHRKATTTARKNLTRSHLIFIFISQRKDVRVVCQLSRASHRLRPIPLLSPWWWTGLVVGAQHPSLGAVLRPHLIGRPPACVMALLAGRWLPAAGGALNFVG